MNYKALILDSWQTAEEKGFHDGNPKEREYIEQKLLLIISEVGEAVEAHRRNRFANLAEFRAQNQRLLDVADIYYDNDPNKVFADAFEGAVKDRFEDELADIYIRLADLAGIAGVSDIKIGKERASKAENLPKALNDFVSWILTGLRLSLTDRREDKRSLEASFQIGFRLLNRIVELVNIDIEEHLRLKIRYNKTRPHKHGKAY